MVKVIPRLAEFSAANVPIEELDAFYTIANVAAPEDRPYVWSNSMTTLDGFMHYNSTASAPSIQHSSGSTPKSELEHGSVESDIALKKHPQAGPYSLADYRLLNAGWVYADAVLSSGPCLRTDPLLRHVPIFKDMQQHRTQVLNKPFAPLHIAVTSKASTLPFSTHSFFNSPDLPVLVVTHESDVQPSIDAFIASKSTGGNPDTCLWSPALHEPNTPGTVHLSQLLRFLKLELQINSLEIDAGGSMIRNMIDLKLIDELRWTQVGHVIGGTDALGNPRPSLFNSPSADSYTANTSPVFRMAGIRAIGEHFLFLRTVLEHWIPLYVSRWIRVFRCFVASKFASGFKQHASEFLLALPMEGLHLVMSPVEYRAILRYRLLMPLYTGRRRCRHCEHVMDLFGDHAFCCGGHSGSWSRHNFLRDTLAALVRQVGILCRENGEVRLPSSSGDLWPADLLVYDFYDGKTVCVDISVVHPLTSRGLVGFKVGNA
ncbi:hypothetical protein HDU79_005480, partial [Rhizoclosmatium sp. JEL0117]